MRNKVIITAEDLVKQKDVAQIYLEMNDPSFLDLKEQTEELLSEGYENIFLYWPETEERAVVHKRADRLVISYL